MPFCALFTNSFIYQTRPSNQDDDYSDVDMYMVVVDGNKERFLKKRLGYMQSYMPLTFWTESNFVGLQIIGAYENALLFDLYMVSENTFPQIEDIKIIYDRNNI